LPALGFPLAFALGGDVPEFIPVVPLDGDVDVVPSARIDVDFDFNEVAHEFTSLIITVEDVVVWQSDIPLNGWYGIRVGKNLEHVGDVWRYQLYPVGIPYGTVVNVNASWLYDGITERQTFDYSYTTQTDPTCWDGSSPTDFEILMGKSLTLLNTEKLRKLLLSNCITEGGNAAERARTLLQLVNKSILRTFVFRAIPTPEFTFTTIIKNQTTPVNLDKILKGAPNLIAVTLKELVTEEILPLGYDALVQASLDSASPVSRVAAAIALVLLAVNHVN